MFGFKHRNYFLRRLKALLLTIMLVIIIIFSLLVYSYSSLILHFDLLKGINEITKLLLAILRWTVVLMFIFFTIKIVYMVTPRYRIPGKYTNFGALSINAYHYRIKQAS
ncbi:YhjD/YihY/BrkB family envelope integrity protein [Paenibacillus sp. Z3-2]